MKICIYGAGAIGGFLGVQLALAEAEVSLVARGPHLRAMQEHGLLLRIGGEERRAHPPCVGAPAELGEQDVVIVSLKAHSVPAAVDAMRPLLGKETVIVTAQNGIPWWYFHRLTGEWEGRTVESVDPGGRIWHALGPERAIGCVVYPSCEIEAPGVVRHRDGNRFMLGEPDGSKSRRVVALSKILKQAGFKAPVRPRIRDDIWLKLWGNVSFNPVSVLTGATLEEMAADGDVRGVIRRLMVEAGSVAERLGAKFPVDVDTRIRWAADVGAHKTSMLQDLEAGRRMEIEALVGAVAELGRLVGVKTPTLDLVLALVRLRAASALRDDEGCRGSRDEAN